MPSTPKGFPYPDATDPVSLGAADIQALAEAVDGTPIGEWSQTAAGTIPASTVISPVTLIDAPSPSNRGGIFSLAGGIVTISEAGWFLLTGQVIFQAAGTGDRIIFILANGAEVVRTASGPGVGGSPMGATAIAALPAGAAVSLGIFHTHTGDLVYSGAAIRLARL